MAPNMISQDTSIVLDKSGIDVDPFVHLKGVISADRGVEFDIAGRINSAGSTFAALSIIEDQVETVLCSSLLLMLQAFVNTCLRHIIEVPWPDTISNSKLSRHTEQSPVDELRRRKWQWIDHTVERDDNSCTMQWNLLSQDDRRVGRPKSTWIRTGWKGCRVVGK